MSTMKNKYLYGFSNFSDLICLYKEILKNHSIWPIFAIWPKSSTFSLKTKIENQIFDLSKSNFPSFSPLSFLFYLSFIRKTDEKPKRILNATEIYSIKNVPDVQINYLYQKSKIDKIEVRVFFGFESQIRCLQVFDFLQKMNGNENNSFIDIVLLNDNLNQLLYLNIKYDLYYLEIRTLFDYSILFSLNYLDSFKIINLKDSIFLSFRDYDDFIAAKHLFKSLNQKNNVTLKNLQLIDKNDITTIFPNDFLNTNIYSFIIFHIKSFYQIKNSNLLSVIKQSDLMKRDLICALDNKQYVVLGFKENKIRDETFLKLNNSDSAPKIKSYYPLNQEKTSKSNFRKELKSKAIINSENRKPVFNQKNGLFYIYFQEYKKTKLNYSSNKVHSLFGVQNIVDIQRNYSLPNSKNEYTFIGFQSREDLIKAINDSKSGRNALKANALNGIIHKIEPINQEKQNYQGTSKVEIALINNDIKTNTNSQYNDKNNGKLDDEKHLNLNQYLQISDSKNSNIFNSDDDISNKQIDQKLNNNIFINSNENSKIITIENNNNDITIIDNANNNIEKRSVKNITAQKNESNKNNNVYNLSAQNDEISSIYNGDDNNAKNISAQYDNCSISNEYSTNESQNLNNNYMIIRDNENNDENNISTNIKADNNSFCNNKISESNNNSNNNNILNKNINNFTQEDEKNELNKNEESIKKDDSLLNNDLNISIEEYISIMELYYRLFIDFIEKVDSDSVDYQKVAKSILSIRYHENLAVLKEVINIILSIADNHHRSTNFNTKINQLILLFIKDIQKHFTNNEIFDIFQHNLNIILFLLEEKLLYFNKEISKIIIDKKSKNFLFFFYPEMKEFLPDKDRKKIELKIKKHCGDINTLLIKRKIGENHNHLCELIRNDLIDEFIPYYNSWLESRPKAEYSFEFANKVRDSNPDISSLQKLRESKPNFQKSRMFSKGFGTIFASDNNAYIERSKFETNPMLIHNDCVFIQYAAFFGSTKIFEYLFKMDNYSEFSFFWILAIHSDNPAMIDLLRKYKIKIDLDKCLKESIKCHHLSLVVHFLKNILVFCDQDILFQNLNRSIKYNNYSFMLKEHIKFASNDFLFYQFCKYNHVLPVKLLLKSTKVNINISHISN